MERARSARAGARIVRGARPAYSSRLGCVLFLAGGILATSVVAGQSAVAATNPWRLAESLSTARDGLSIAGTCPARIYSVGGMALDASSATRVRLRTGRIVGLSAGVNPRFLSVAAARKAPAIAYAASDQAGVLKTTDGGRSWHLLSGVAANQTSHPVAVATSGNGRTVYVEVAGTAPGLLVSSDGGARWRHATAIALKGAATVPGGPVVDPTRASTVYVGFIGTRGAGRPRLYGLAVSRDAGRTWSVRSFARAAVSALAVMPKAPRTLVAGTADGFYRSSDGGQSWRALASAGISDFAGQAAEVRRLVAAGGAKGPLYALTGSGVWQSRDAGGNWIRISKQAGKVRPSDIALTPDGTMLVAVGATASGGGVAVMRVGRAMPRCAK